MSNIGRRHEPTRLKPKVVFVYSQSSQLPVEPGSTLSAGPRTLTLLLYSRDRGKVEFAPTLCEAESSHDRTSGKLLARNSFGGPAA